MTENENENKEQAEQLKKEQKAKRVNEQLKELYSIYGQLKRNLDIYQIQANNVLQEIERVEKDYDQKKSN